VSSATSHHTERLPGLPLGSPSAARRFASTSTFTATSRRPCRRRPLGPSTVSSPH